jgi:hypothetical protein
MSCGFEWGDDLEHDETNHVCILSKDHEQKDHFLHDPEHECYCGEAVEELEK